MMLLERHSNKLSPLLLLLIVALESSVCDGCQESGDPTTPSPPDPNADQAVDLNNIKTANQQKSTLNREKWRARGKKIVEFFTRKPVERTGTLEQVKVVLMALYKLMDSKIFERCANPLGFRIDHFDVKNHLFTREYIKINPYNERFMNTYDKFLQECCHPLLDMYKQRLNDDQTEEQKLGNPKYKLDSNPYREQPKFIVNTAPVTNSEDPLAKPAPAPTPPAAETPTPYVDVGSQPLPRHAEQSTQKGKNTRSKASWITLKKPAFLNREAAKRDDGGVNHQLGRRKLKKGTFQPQALTYWQKAFIYRTIKWATPFLIEPKYGPSILLKRKLDEIVNTYAMNLLDPELGNLKPSKIYFDCIPVKPTDLENCCLDKDRSIEHLYHLSDVYNKQKKKKKEEKQERKRLGIKTDTSTKEHKLGDKKLSEKAKFKRKLEKDLVEYGFYPNETTKKELVIEVIDAFLSEKFKQIFSMKPKDAKKITRKRYKIRKYQERAKKFRMQQTQTEQTTSEPVESQLLKTETNGLSGGEGQAPWVETVQEENSESHTRPGNIETWQQKYILKPWLLCSNAVIGCFSGNRGNSSKNEKQPTEIPDGSNHTPAHTVDNQST